VRLTARAGCARQAITTASKPVMYLFSQPWCGACKRLKADFEANGDALLARAEGTTAEVGYSRRQETVQEESLRALSSAGGEREAHHASAAKANCKANDLPPCTIRAG